MCDTFWTFIFHISRIFNYILDLVLLCTHCLILPRETTYLKNGSFWVGFSEKWRNRSAKNANFRVNLFRQKKHFSETDWRKTLWKKRNCHIYFFISQNSASFLLPFAKFIFAKKCKNLQKLVGEVRKKIFTNVFVRC